MQSKIIHANNLDYMLTLESESTDLVCSDIPYRIEFMGKKWDQRQIFTKQWKECFRILKPGGFMILMNTPRQDCELMLLNEVKEAGFDMSFTPVYWTYGSGFPKAMNIGRALDNQLIKRWFKQKFGYSKSHVSKKYTEIKKHLKGSQRDIIDAKLQYWEYLIKARWAREEYHIEIRKMKYEHPLRQNRSYETKPTVFSQDRKNDKIHTRKRTFAGDHNGSWDNAQIKNVNYKEVVSFGGCSEPTGMKRNFTQYNIISDEGRDADGSYAGWQPKPAVEVIHVFMKPLDKSSYIAQWKSNRKGVTWIDECKIPYTSEDDIPNATKDGSLAQPSGSGVYNWNSEKGKKIKKKLVGGRLKHGYSISDERLEGFKNQDFDDVEPDLTGRFPANVLVSDKVLELNSSFDLSHYFSLDSWYAQKITRLPSELQQIFPFLYCPKPQKEERNFGLDDYNKHRVSTGSLYKCDESARKYQAQSAPRKNIHPTVKPLSLMMYLVSLFSEKGDIVVDPFVGSGTTVIAAHILQRIGIGIELTKEYADLARDRLHFFKDIQLTKYADISEVYDNGKEKQTVIKQRKKHKTFDEFF